MTAVVTDGALRRSVGVFHLKRLDSSRELDFRIAYPTDDCEADRRTGHSPLAFIFKSRRNRLESLRICARIGGPLLEFSERFKIKVRRNRFVFPSAD